MATDGPPRKIGAGALEAAFRQGAKELATALKAFPESISVDEPGTVFSPTQGEIAEANRGGLDARLKDARERADAARDEPAKGLDRE